MEGPADAPQLEGEQGAQGAAGGDQLGAGQVGSEAVEIEAGKVGGEQEQAAEGGAEAARGEVEGAAVGERGLQHGGLLLGGAAGELGQAGRAQDLVDKADAVGQVFAAQAGGDVVDGEVVLAQNEDALAGAGGGVAGGAGGSGSGPAGGEQELGIVAAEELGAEIAKAAGGVAEATGSLGGGATVDEAGAEGLVAALARGGRLEEAVRRIRHLPHEPMNIVKHYHDKAFASSRKPWREGGIWPIQAVSRPEQAAKGKKSSGLRENQAGIEGDRSRSAAGAVSADGY